MAGCFGNHPVDRWVEGQLNQYLNSDTDKYKCEGCDFEAFDEDWDYDEETNELVCPNCNFRIKL